MAGIEFDGVNNKIELNSGAAAADQHILFNGNAQDFYIALDDSADDLLIGLGSAVGTTPMLSFTEAKAASFAGAVTMASTLDVTTVATAATFEPDGDTAAGDNAAIGYTSAEGLILTGQGSTSDITLKNDADATVFTVPTGTDDILFPDSAKAMFGAGSDLQLYHDGSNSYIQDEGTGDLKITTNGTAISLQKGTSETLAYFATDSGFNLYHDNVERIGTTATATVLNETGIDIDFRVESDDNTHMIFVDGGSDHVNIGTSTDHGAVFNIQSTDNTATLALASTDTDANSGPRLDFVRNPGQAGADADYLSAILHRGYNDATELTTFAEWNAQIVDASNGSEDGRFYINTMVAGVAGTNRMDFTPSETVFNEGGADLDFRVESDESTKAFFVDGDKGHCHITGASSATKVAWYSSGLGAIQLGVGATLAAYDYGVIDGPYLLHNEWFDGASNKYIATGEAARFGMYNGRHIFYTAASGSADASCSVSHKFEIANDGTLTGTDTDGVGSNSDQRLKENIQDYSYDISKFKSFKPRTFDWKNPEAHTHEATTGFVAQEVESIDNNWTYEISWDNSKANNAPKEAEEKALCGGEDKKASKLGRKDAMYISVIQQLITRIEALEG